jgi:hypothetical protein
MLCVKNSMHAIRKGGGGFQPTACCKGAEAKEEVVDLAIEEQRAEWAIDDAEQKESVRRMKGT